MPKVEIDEVQLRQHHKLAQTVNTIMKHPQAKLLVQQAHKLVDPNASTPALDQARMLNAPIEALEKKFDTFIAETKKTNDEREQNEKLSGLQKKRDDGFAHLRGRSYTEEGIKAVEALMVEKGLLDPLDAAAIFEKAHPPMAPATPGGGGAWNFAEGINDDQADIKKLLESKGGNDVVVDRMAHSVLSEVRGAQLRR